MEKQNPSIIDSMQTGLDERLKLKELAEFADHKVVPMHKHSFWYYFGGLSLFFFVVQMISGILLLFHYEAGIETAYASIMKLNTQVEFGQIIRSIHSWSANLMVVTVIIHMFSAYFMRAYKKPREITWFSGAILLLLTVVLGFTGYLLPWDDIAYFATKVGLDIAESTPWIEAEWNESWIWVGSVLANILRGGHEITNLTIQRFFGLHVVILPWVFAAVLMVHLFMIQLHGISIPDSIKEKGTYKEIKFFPTFALDEIFAWLMAFSVLALIVLINPWGLGPEADPLAPAAPGIHPEWYFMAPFEVLKWMPPSVGIINGEFIGVALFGIVTVVMMLVPLWDRGKNPAMAKLAIGYGVFCLVTFLFFTLFGYWCLSNNDFCTRVHDFLPWVFRGFH